MYVSQYTHLASLDLADEAEGNSNLEDDLHLDFDIYWEIVTGGESWRTHGEVAVHTKLGRELFGPIQLESMMHSHTNLVVSTHVYRVDT